MTNYMYDVEDFIVYLRQLSPQEFNTNLSFRDFINNQLDGFISSTNEDDFDIEHEDQHFFNLLYFIDENKIEEFKNYLDRILTYPEGRKVLDNIFLMDDKVEVTGSSEMDDLDVIPYGYMIFYAINRCRKEIFSIMLEYGYPLSVTQNDNSEKRDMNPLEYLVYLSIDDSEYMNHLHLINYCRNKTEFINENLCEFIKAQEYAKEINNSETQEMINNILNKKDIVCRGCIDEQPNQQAHMDLDGCMYDENY